MSKGIDVNLNYRFHIILYEIRTPMCIKSKGIEYCLLENEIYILNELHLFIRVQ